MINPCAIIPAIIIKKKVIVAKAPVTLKLAVAVTPPLSTVFMVLYLSEYGTSNRKRLIDPRTSKIGTNPIPFANRMKKKNVSNTGAHETVMVVR